MAQSASPVPPAAPEASLARTYILVVVLECVVIAALYWFGRRFS